MPRNSVQRRHENWVSEQLRLNREVDEQLRQAIANNIFNNSIPHVEPNRISDRAARYQHMFSELMDMIPPVEPIRIEAQHTALEHARQWREFIQAHWTSQGIPISPQVREYYNARGISTDEPSVDYLENPMPPNMRTSVPVPRAKIDTDPIEKKEYNMPINKDNYRVGWELEYQNSDYSNESEDCDPEFDEEMYDAWTDEKESEILEEHFGQWRRLDTEINNSISNLDIENDDDSETLANWDKSDKTYQVACNLDLLSTDDILYLIRNYIDTPESCYYTPDNDCTGIDLPCGLEWEHDGTVGGGEIHPDSPCTVEKATKLLNELERDYPFDTLDVDDQCSFHVHVSNTDIKHRYGTNMQGFMLQYLSDNLEKLPSSVLQRFSSDSGRWRNQYFSISISQNKYCFVAYRSEHGTWEFRCFGNIETADEGIICMNMAVDAHFHAVNLVRKGKMFKKNINILQVEIPARADAVLRKRKKQQDVA